MNRPESRPSRTGLPYRARRGIRTAKPNSASDILPYRARARNPPKGGAVSSAVPHAGPVSGPSVMGVPRTARRRPSGGYGFFALPRAGRGGPEHGSAAATPHGIVRSEGPDRKPSGRCRRMRKRRIPSRGEVPSTRIRGPSGTYGRACARHGASHPDTGFLPPGTRGRGMIRRLPPSRVRDSSANVGGAPIHGMRVRDFPSTARIPFPPDRAFHTSTGLPPATPRSRRPGDASVAGAGVPFCLFPSGFSTPGAESGPRRPVPERRNAAAGGRPAGRARARPFPGLPEISAKNSRKWLHDCRFTGKSQRKDPFRGHPTGGASSAQPSPGVRSPPQGIQRCVPDLPIAKTASGEEAS